MKIANIMNFVRCIDERHKNSWEPQYKTTAAELDLVNELGLENTFLLQYDVLCDEAYQKLFKEKATERTELGLWYEIVEPLTAACKMPYRSEYGWKWDWHIVPGFSMAYTPKEREMLADEAMRKFKEIFGYYPKSVASWLIDSHTIEYLADRYDISAFAICRDQISTDAYTLIGGYFNQGYYPSRKNMFTPAQTEGERIHVPVFRLLGPCPIHNCESGKYLSAEHHKKRIGCYTLEPGWMMGKTPEYVDWFFKTFYENEDLGFSYTQLGQENSFGLHFDIITPLRMQLEKITKLKQVQVKKMCDTGEAFKKLFPNKTPATSVVATDNWDTEDVQSIYYNCQNYTANLFRYENSVFIRSLFLFDERVPDRYLTEPCTGFEAIYENLPIIHNQQWNRAEKKNCGLVVDSEGAPLTAEKIKEGVLRVSWKDRLVTFEEEKITIRADRIRLLLGEPEAKISLSDHVISYEYKGNAYGLRVENATVCQGEDGSIEIRSEGEDCMLFPTVTV